MTPGATPSQTVGPFFSFGLCERPAADLVPVGAEGVIEIGGRVVDGGGDPVPDAVVEIWQADSAGVYRPDFGWGRCGTGPGGEFAFRTIKPGRVEGQAPHLTVLVFARGLVKPVLTRLYFPDEGPANAADPVLAGIDDADDRATLIATVAPGGFRFDVRLQGDRQTVFFVTAR